MNSDLMTAILAMDSYNRKDPSRTNASPVGMELQGTTIGNWTLTARLDRNEDNFYAQAYSCNGEVVISYRGTDSNWDIPDWATGAGDYWTDQTRLAADFYRTVAALNPASEIMLTGHSLGGGLAGFVGSIYGVSGVLFDNMPFEFAASNLYAAACTSLGLIRDPIARQEFYSGEEPSPIDSSGLRGYAVDGEALESLRGFQNTPVTELDPHTSWGGAVQRHSQSLLVILLYAKQIAATGGAAEAKWANLATNLIANLFNIELAQAVGVGGIQGTSTLDEKLRSMLAYSAIDEGTRPFGDSGIRALFDDANQLGEILSRTNVSQPLKDAVDALCKIIVQYAGHLALWQDMSASGKEGVLSVDEDFLNVDLSADKWNPDGEGGDTIVGKQVLVNQLLDGGGPLQGNPARLGMEQLWGSSEDAVITQVTFLTKAQAGEVQLEAPSQSDPESVTLVVGTGAADKIVGSNAGEMIAGAGGADELSGGAGNDLLLGGLGSDKLKGGAGDDVLVGGAEIDTASYQDPGAETGLEAIIKGVGFEDYYTSGVELTLTGGGKDLLFEIEKIELTDKADTIKLHDSEYGLKYTLITIDAGNQGSGKDVLDCSELVDPLELTGGDTMAMGQCKLTGFEKIIASTQDDSIVLKQATVALEIIGGTGNDTITTGSGADTLDGGEGDDTLDGGAGADTFVIGGTSGKDTIVKLEAGDVIKVNGSVLVGGEREEDSGEPYEDSAGNKYIWTGSGPLIILPAGGGSILISDFKNGDGGIHLEEMDDPDEEEPPVSLPPRGYDPLVLDRDGDGVELRPIGSTMFDLNGDGIRERVGWVSPDDAFLARDLNGNGAIDGISELYGSATQTGFDALAAEDTNGDGLVDAQDAGWSHMRVWQDTNANGRTDAGELLTMEQAQIRSIGLAHQDGSWWGGGGGTIIEKGFYTSTGGTLYQAASALFQADPYRTQVEIPAGFEYPPEVKLLPDLNGTGQVVDLSYAMALDPELAATARALVTGAATMSGVQFRAGFEAFLMQWAGVENVDPDSRGSFVNARHMAFAEKMLGTTFTFRQGEPDSTEGMNVRDLCRLLIDSLIVRFAAQVGPSAVFLAENPEDGLAHPFWAFASLLYDRETGIISGKFGWTMTAVLNKAPPEPADQVGYFEQMMPLVRALMSAFPSTTIQNVQAALATLEDKALAEFAYDVMFQSPPILGTDGADVVSTPPSPWTTGATLYGGHGNDTLTGASNSYDTYLYAAGSGHDTITNSGGNSDSDELLLIGIRPSDVTAQANVPAAGDIKLVFAGGGSLVLKGYATNLAIGRILFADGTIWKPVDVHNAALAALGTAGADTITGYGTANVLDGKQGNDLLSGGQGGDTYLIRSGDGQDTIDDNGLSPSSYNGGTDRIHFLGRASTGFTLTRSGNDAILTFVGSTDSITIKNQFSVGSADEIEEFMFADGVTVTAADLRNLYLAQLTTAGNDTINGFASSDDVIRGGLGNDTLDGKSGGDLYLWQIGDGNDVINDTGSANDRLRLDGVLSSQVTIVRVGLDAHVRIGPETIVLKNQFHSSGANVIERIEFADGAWSASEIAFRTIWPVSDVPSLIGGDAGETLLGTSGNDGLAGMGGNDTLKGAAGSDTYFWAPGDGNDVIEDIGGSSAIDADILKLAGQPADFLISRVGNNLVLRCLATGETLTLVNQLVNSTKAIERIVFTDGTIWQEADIAAHAVIRGTDGNDTVTGTTGHDRLDGGLGTDTLRGGSGQDTYLFGSNSGNDVIEENSDFGPALDRVQLAFTLDEVEFLRSGNQLIIRVIATGQTLTDALHYSGSSTGIEEFVFADGTTLTKLEAEALALVKGTDAAESLQGSYGNDTILGGLGDDTVSGSYGSDTYLWRLGDGSDRIYESGSYVSPGTDTLRLIGIDPASVTLSHADGDLLITMASGEVITAVDVFGYGNSGIERIVFDDGTIWDRDLILHKGAQFGSDGNDHVISGALDDLIAGGGGHDNMQGGGGDDTLRGGAGSDQLSGDAGNDLLQGGAGSDWMMHGGDGNDHLQGEAGADKLYYSHGNDTLEGGEGDDAYRFYDYDNSVTIREGAASGGGDDDGDDEDDDDYSDGDGLLMGMLRDTDFDFRREGDDLIIVSLHSNHVTRVENHFLDDGSGLEWIRFGMDEDGYGGYDWDRAMIEARVVNGPTVKLITGTILADTLHGDWGANTIKGYGGNDTLTGNGGNDTLEGGAGDDWLMGGAGSDTYRYTDLSGSDTIVDEGGLNDEDLFEIKVLEASAFTFTRSGDDLLLQNLATGQITTFVDQFLGDGSGIEAIWFAASGYGSGYVWDRAMIEAQVLSGSASSHNGDWL